ncbi:hypothetical protein OPV22_003819 [Ensete ventricosum]|uniref:Prolyl 4-hydroxylase alpha subunit domain-containing protein n=1 Tax=Ensete ventricosum TaxID=4639 RepID=A0AAV8S220_ENSVE|nr:hypothetical protein OPV22_003819 [Ensete ventricosum]
MARGARYSRTLLGRRSSSFTLILAALLTASVVLLMLLAFGIFSLPVGSDDRAKPDLRSRLSVHESKDEMGQIGDQWTEVLSWEPRAFIYHNFLSKKECDYLIELAKPHMEKSTVVDSATGRSKDSRVRTSSGMFLRRGKDKIIHAIEKRIADYTFIPVEHGEGLQVLHYEVGQKYDPHYDYFHDEFNTKNGGQRIATLLMYLSDVEEGGETVFPSVKMPLRIHLVCTVDVLLLKEISGLLQNGCARMSTGLSYQTKQDCTPRINIERDGGLGAGRALLIF